MKAGPARETFAPAGVAPAGDVPASTESSTRVREVAPQPSTPSDLSFDPKRPETWPVVLTVAQIAAIYQRTEGALRKAMSNQRFHLAPMRGRPYRWRRVDVIRDVEGARGSLQRAS